MQWPACDDHCLVVRIGPQDPPEGFVQNYCLLIGDKSFSNFQKVRVRWAPAVAPPADPAMGSRSSISRALPALASKSC